MSISKREINIITARQLIITRQHLSGNKAPSMLDVIRDIGCLQLDPISAVARSHQLVLWSRLGYFKLSDLDNLLWEERSLFEYWGHEASIVLTEEYPIHAHRMSNYMTGDSPWAKRARDWLENPNTTKIHNMILERIQSEGPLPARVFKDFGADFPANSGWTGPGNATRMIQYMWHRGEIMVAKRQGIQRIWDISERCLPDWTPREELTDDEITHYAAQKAIRALGVATAKQINEHYTRRRYPGLDNILEKLEKEQRIQKIELITESNTTSSGQYYIHNDDLPLLEKIEAGAFMPRTVLLSPFDNLICNRNRTEELFNFHFRIEIYVPKAKRQYGYYVLPILHGDRLIGRLDPKFDRKKKLLHINAIYLEDETQSSPAIFTIIRESIEELAQFLDAEQVLFGNTMPSGWRDN